MGGGCEGKRGGNPPAIQGSFAAREIAPGATWKIYLRASDPDGDMKRIVCTIDQPGAGAYPVRFIPIPEDQKKELSGYIYLHTFQSQGMAHLTLRLTIQIQDQGKNESPPIHFPLRFNPLAKEEEPPPGTFGERDLGPIMIELVPLKSSAA
jgi:hypothetical protein